MSSTATITSVPDLGSEFVQALIRSKRYSPIEELQNIFGLLDQEHLRRHYVCHSGADSLDASALRDCEIVTGFGPTNAPTAGTLSMILKAIWLQRALPVRVSITISDLGAWASRNTDLRRVRELTARFLDFIPGLGFDAKRGVLRTHEDTDGLRLAGLIAKGFHTADFAEHSEATDGLYQKMGLLGSDFGKMVDATYTVADILLPVIHSGRSRILVTAGIEEHYFVELARILIHRFARSYPSLLFPADTGVAALYGRLVPGLTPFPKMSKSIPRSAITVEEDEASIAAKIMECASHDEYVIMAMIELVSDWPDERVEEARARFAAREESPTGWRQAKAEYLEYFLQLKGIWDATRPRVAIPVIRRTGCCQCTGRS